MPPSMLAVVPVRDGRIPAGGLEAIAEAGGRAILVGSDAASAVEECRGIASAAWIVDGDPTDVIATAIGVAGAVAFVDETASLVLPASPDGRDLAPHVADLLGRRLFAGAVEVVVDRVRTSQDGGLRIAEHRPTAPFVATLQPGTRGVEVATSPSSNTENAGLENIGIEHVKIENVAGVRSVDESPRVRTVMSEKVLPPDVTTMDLAEAPRIVGGGAGLESAERFAQLARVSAAIDASMGVTRVITDRAWAEHDRQIGTTGVVVSPRLYLSFGVSGAVQHTSGLGQPQHVISVNLDAHCPMMQMSDLAVVSDANLVLDELERLLGERR
jgi:electron transfer flavoprotein alpha subunit